MNRKEKMTKKNKEGAAFTDDGFAMGKVFTDFFITLLDERF